MFFQPNMKNIRSREVTHCTVDQTGHNYHILGTQVAILRPHTRGRPVEALNYTFDLISYWANGPSRSQDIGAALMLVVSFYKRHYYPCNIGAINYFIPNVFLLENMSNFPH